MSTRRSTAFGPLTALANGCLALTLVACGSDADSALPADWPAEEAALPAEPPPDFGQVKQEILNGTPLTLTTQAIIYGEAFGGFVALSHSPSGTEKVFCSGTLLTNSMLITAKHCLTAGSTSYLVNNPSSLNISMGRAVFRQDRAAQTIHFHATHDLALVTVSPGFLMVNAQESLDTTGYFRPFPTTAAADLDGISMACFGHGREQETCDSSGNNCTGSGVGTLRFATLEAEFNDPNTIPPFFRFHPNAEGQLMAHGDSGGSCVEGVTTIFLGRPDKAQIFSVHATASPGNFANDTPFELAFEPGWSQVSP